MVRRGSLLAAVVLLLAGCWSVSTAQTVSWTPTGGPGGGEVYSMVRDSAGRLFATVVRAGVFRSDDGGTTWQEVNRNLWVASGGAILVLPGDDVLLAVGSHIYRSADHGENWLDVNSTAIGETRRFVFAPDGAVLAAGNGAGIFRSVDRGSTWEHVLANGSYVFDIAVSPVTGHVYAAAGQQGDWGLYRSIDEGVTWGLLESYPGNGQFGLRAVTVLPTGRILVSREGCVDPTVPWGVIYYSDDDGATWLLSPTTVTRCDAKEFVRDADGAIWAPLRQDGGVARSTDDGVTWNEVGLSPKDINTVLLPPGGALLAGSSSTGVWRGLAADPAGVVAVNAGLRGSNTQTVFPVGNGRLLAGTTFGLSQSDDNGSTWRTVAAHTLGYESQSVCKLIARAPGGALVASLNGFMARSWDDGDTWSVTPVLDPVTNQWVGDWISASAAATDSAGRLYLTGWWGYPTIWVSGDNAVTFAPTTSTPMPWEGGPARSMAFDGDDVMYVGTMYMGLYRSTDYGVTLEPLAFAGQDVGALLVDGDAVYAGVSGSGVWRSTDGGDTWTQLYQTTSGINALVENAEGTLFLAQSGGVVTASNDQFATWVDNASFDRAGVDVQGIALDSAGYLYAATWGGGVYRSAETTHHADTTPPTVTASPNRDELWPPNGKLVPVVVTGVAADAGSGVAGTTGSYMVADEYGRVQPHGTFVVGADGTFTFSVLLEASRAGRDKNGRTYVVTVTVHDVASNEASTQFAILVPHDQGK